MAFDKTSYYREKYKGNPEFRDKMKEYVKTYQQTKKGKKTSKKASKKWRKKNTVYITQYSKKSRQEAITMGICSRCFKNRAEPQKKTCLECSEKRKIYFKLKHPAIPQE